MRILAALLTALTLLAAPGASFAASAHDFEFTSIDSGPLALSQYRGRPILVVNTASQCGFTPQYEGLQALWERYRDRGLVVIGAPSDDFNQELASEAEVKKFCEVTFGLDFPMTEIVHVRGAQAHPFFAWATEQAGSPKWNFYKYLIGPDGQVVDWYGSRTEPDDAGLRAEVEKLLGAGG